jgi:hypothetical protein
LRAPHTATVGVWARLVGAVRRALGTGQPPAPTSIEGRLIRGRLMGRRDQVAMLDAYADHAHLHSVTRGRAEVAGAITWQTFRARRAATTRELGVADLRGADFANAMTDLKKAGDIEPVDSELQRLLRRPAPGMSGADWWELQCVYDMLLGEHLWLKAARDQRGRPTILHSVVPTWLQQWPAPGGDPEYVIQAPGGVIRAPAADVVWRRRHDPKDPQNNRGLGTAYALRDEMELDELLAEMARSRAANRNFPDLLIGLLGTQGPGSRPPGQVEVDLVMKLLEQKHGGGPSRAGLAHVISGAFQAQALGHTMVEAQYIDTRRFNRDTHLQTFHQPPELAGVLDNANRSTIAASEDLEARRAIVPLYERWRGTVQDEIAPDFGDLIVGYVSPVPADKEHRAGIFKALPQAMTINEIRAEAGLPPRPDGDEFYKGPGAVPVAGSPSSPTKDASKKKQEAAP